MHHFAYFDGILHAEKVNLARLAHSVGTPFYCYSSATLERHYTLLARAFAGLDALVCFAVKANSNQAVLKLMAKLGAGMDVVSEGELRRARAAGVPPERIIFAGVGKTPAEIAYAVSEGILGFNAESVPELAALSAAASALGREVRVALRVNPDVDAGTHAKITTGRSENKFGIPYGEARALYAEARKMPGLQITGVHMHIGSQITDLGPFRRAFGLLRTLVLDLRRDGHEIRHIDIGGGLGVLYDRNAAIPPDPAAYAALAREAFGDLGAKIILEPGRLIAASAGILLTSVILVKESRGRTFTVVDAAMNDLVRPTLYEAYHDICPVREPSAGTAVFPQDLVGPVCETGDYLALGRPLPRLEAGDLLAVMTAGAYGAVMASTYNTRRLVPEVLVHGEKSAIIRPRPSYEDLIGLDRVPDWLC